MGTTTLPALLNVDDPMLRRAVAARLARYARHFASQGRFCASSSKVAENFVVGLSGEHSTLEVAELFGVGRSTVYRAIERQRTAAKAELADASARR